MSFKCVRRGAQPLCALVVTMASVASAQAAVTFSATSGTMSAKADFSVVGTDLHVTLTNDSSADVLVPVDVLTGLFFDITGPSVVLTPFSAVLAAGSLVLFDPAPVGGVVGGEWAYAAGLVGAPGAAARGISSAGLGLFGNANFPGPNLEPPAAVDGLQYGITSAGDNPATGNTPVTGTNPLIKNSVDFVFTGLPAGFDLSRITNVWFQYGTALSEPSVAAPTPGAASLFGVIVLMGLRRRR